MGDMLVIAEPKIITSTLTGKPVQLLARLEKPEPTFEEAHMLLHAGYRSLLGALATLDDGQPEITDHLTPLALLINRVGSRAWTERSRQAEPPTP